MQLSATAKNVRLRLDPRTKFFFLLFVGVFSFSAPLPGMETAVMSTAVVLLLGSGQWRSSAKLATVYTAMLLLDLLVAPLLASGLSTLFYTVVRLARMMLPTMTAALLLIRTTTVSEFIAAFHKMHLPDTFIIPVSVMFRFIPTVSEEWRAIQSAMRFRGIGVSAKSVLLNPIGTLEYMLVPLLMSTATISGDLAAASLSRGLESGAGRTCVRQIRLGLLDYTLLSGCLGLAVALGVSKLG
ncbi:energy-coupling factor transporter transmembrane protein EcfT [Oscillospiraceae bacterium OttesenSCG-928-F05]|nr:energy-coupling factor transporter transmembrane protein EcfT [Oscillospiraceae bacterium OttesenSCG-928-F05]